MYFVDVDFSVLKYHLGLIGCSTVYILYILICFAYFFYQSDQNLQLCLWIFYSFYSFPQFLSHVFWKSFIYVCI